ncbi:MAG: ABC transporter ATP-binding protein, partial [Acidimicrobiia bacterium]|nr:ABC transporter ATP-binding protein [Acidimicrobiia bacterium]
LGPNGSGKTTTIRCLLGLAAPSAGHARLLGADPTRALHTVIARVGSMVETPSFFPTLSGRRTLELLAGTLGIGPSAVAAALDGAGLADRADDPVRAYSLGMRQRLGLAAALLRDPEVLILDEPANGLDPAGIKETRELLRRLGDEGRTVVLSSHLLAEVQHVCDRVAILDRGRCIAAGSVAEVLHLGHASGLLVRIDQPAAAQAALAAVGLTARACGEGRLLVDLAPDAGADVARALAGAGLYPSELRAQDADLETVFLELTATSAKESAHQ